MLCHFNQSEIYFIWSNINFYALFCYDTDNCLLIGPIFIHRWDFFAGEKSCLTKLTQKYPQQKQPLKWAYKCIWEVRAPSQAAGFQG